MKINAILYGATGMIGSGVLIEILKHPDVKSVLVVGRRSCEVDHQKLREILHKDFLDYSAIEDQMTGYNACFFCLGVSSVGMSEEKYSRITYEFVKKAGETLSRLNPEMTFCFISGAGTDATEKSKTMWARVKGKAENVLKPFPFKTLYIMRPAYVQPMKGVKSIYFMSRILAPLYPLWKLIFPKYVVTTKQVGLAMIHAVLYGSKKQTLESIDISMLAESSNANFLENI